MPESFFPMISRMKYITRWGLMRNTVTENIQEHSHMVSVLAHAIALIDNKYFGGENDLGEIVIAALYHDASEILTGDMPTPIKYDNPEIRTAYKKVELAAQNRLLSMLPPDLRDDFCPILSPQNQKDQAIIKAADKLCAYLKCVEETSAGNREFETARAQTYAALCENTLPALDYFMTHFLHDFELTLDELSQKGGQ